MSLPQKKGDDGFDSSDFGDSNTSDDDLKGLSGDLRCNTKFWRCLGGVVKSGAHYLQEPGGITK